MSTRLRSTWLASAGAVVLVLLFAGLAAGRVVLTEDAPAPEVTTPDTTTAFADLNGNGIDDACEEVGTVVPDPTAEASAAAAVDEDADGVISVPEAAHSDRTSGTNCNHGGYVSWVAQGSPDPTEQTEAAAPTTECVPVAPPERDPALDEQKNGHGKWVSIVAQFEATGGKNCNHGGAVSEAAKKDHDAAAAARAAAKAAREAARAEAKANRQHGKPKN